VRKRRRAQKQRRRHVILPWERQSPHWHTSGSGKRQALEFTAESCPGTHFLHHPCIRRRYVHPRRHPCTRRRYVHHGVIPARAAVTSTPGVIPAKAGILTRISFYKGHTIVANYAAIPSRHISYGKGDGLCVLKSLVWIRAI
jgi:hypothetical protein